MRKISAVCVAAAAALTVLSGCGSAEVVTPVNHDQKVLEQGQQIGQDAKDKFGQIQQQQEQQMQGMLGDSQ